VTAVDPDKTLGALLGHAVGECLALPPGAAAAGTQMGFRLADSLIARGGFDPDDVLSAYVAWFGTNPDGLDPATADALRRIAAGSDSYAATAIAAQSDGGPTALARTVPVAIAFAGDPHGLRDATTADAALTDFDPLTGKAALLLNQSIALLVTGGPRALSDSLQDPLRIDDRLQDVVLPAVGGVRAVAEQAAPREPHSVVAPIAVGFAACLTFDSFDDGLRWALHTGGAGNGAACGAVAGALLGARFGATQVPPAWIDRLETRAQVERLHAGLLHLAG
jgi:ADP-ribosyl-[dinitrogen reductase] hydrolase